jgi:penicillin amidase
MSDMASPTLAPPRTSGRLALKISLAVIAAVLLIPIGICSWFYVAAHRALPQLDGTIRVPGLTSPVTVIRDQHGVPHITAASMPDLLFAQGYVTAQDRLWQMDMTRRYGNGDLAEILGPDYVKADRTQRVIGLREVAKRAAAEMSADERGLADAYAKGVNAYIDFAREHLPMEFRVVGYSPRPWTVEDSLVCGATFSEMLNLGYAYDMVRRERVEAKVPPELAADLFAGTSWRDHPPLQKEPEIEVQPELPDPDVLRRQYEREQKLQQKSQPKPKSDTLSPKPEARSTLPSTTDLSPTDQLFPGSNNWVVSGEHTVTGKPLLSNDMHLEHHIPNAWYEVHLTLTRADAKPAPAGNPDNGNFDVAGVSAPGIPFVIEGHNRRIAWGFTNLNPASIDVYIETFNASGEYQVPSGWQKPQIRHEVIAVKKSAPVELEVVITRHGPIVSDIVPGGESRKLALRWVLYEPHTLTLELFHQMNSASNWEEFRSALKGFASPGQNVVYADVDSHIGYQATGWVPVRKKGDATKPVPGNTDDYEWDGYLTLDQMPHVFDPQSGIIATANNRTAPDHWPYLISNQWFSPNRVNRIYRVLHSGKKFTAADMLALQTDTYSSYDQYLANQFVYAVDHSAKATPRARQAADLMRGWKGQLTTETAAPTIETRARRQLQRLLLEPYLGADWMQYTGSMQSVWLENTLMRRPARWLPKTYTSWDDLLANAVDRAANSPDAPKNLSDWTWGEASPVYLQHPVFGRFPLLNRISGPGLLGQSGGSYTVKQVGRGFGPSQRFTADLSDLDHSTMNLVTGEGGNLFSPYYLDQWNAWYRGTTFSFPFSTAEVAKNRTHELRLAP